MNMTEAIAARGIDPVAALRQEIAWVRRRSRCRQFTLVIPGVADAARKHLTSVGGVYRQYDLRSQAKAEAREIDLCPPGTERTREYVRAFDRLNALVHVVVDFPAPCNFEE